MLYLAPIIGSGETGPKKSSIQIFIDCLTPLGVVVLE